MKQLHYTLRFNTPAFMGNAEQSGQWRTPPFKALLRQWWRVAYAADKEFNVTVAAMRREEGLLFGNAWLEGEFCKSLARMRLDCWDAGKLTAWQPCGTVSHPEVRQPIGSDLYLGFGPLTGTRLKANAAIQSGESAMLSFAVPDAHAPRIVRALGLMNSFGTAGGRSRNGWGSFSLTPMDEASALNNTPILRPYKDALALDWPHAIGADDQGAALIWQTAPHEDWKTLMKTLATLKIGMRTQFEFTTGRNAPRTEERHWLSYPVTNHSVAAWGGNARLPNSLRFKVRPTPDGKLIGVIFHVPCKPPAAFNPSNAISAVWQQVHQFLNAQPTLSRSTS